MSEIGHAFIQPGVSCLDGRLRKHKGSAMGGAGAVELMTLCPALPGTGRTAGLAQGALLLETGDSEQTHREPSGQEGNNGLRYHS